MIKKVLKKIERLQNKKNELIAEQSRIQKEIDNVNNEIKKYMALKKEYERIDKKYNDLIKIQEIKEP